MRKTTEEWLELLHAYDPDKQTIKNYCAEHDIAVSSFYKYRSRLQQKQPSNGFIHAEITPRISTQEALPVNTSCILKTAFGNTILNDARRASRLVCFAALFARYSGSSAARAFAENHLNLIQT